MTRNQKLDQILRMLKWRLYKKHQGDASVNKMTIDLILKSSGVEKDDAETKYLTGILEGDGHIIEDKDGAGNTYDITREGERFLDVVGGYEKQQIEIENKRKINKLTIKSLKRSKYAFWISIIAILVSILAFFNQVFEFSKDW